MVDELASIVHHSHLLMSSHSIERRSTVMRSVVDTVGRTSRVIRLPNDIVDATKYLRVIRLAFPIEFADTYTLDQLDDIQLDWVKPDSNCIIAWPDIDQMPHEDDIGVLNDYLTHKLALEVDHQGTGSFRLVATCRSLPVDWYAKAEIHFGLDDQHDQAIAKQHVAMIDLDGDKLVSESTSQ